MKEISKDSLRAETTGKAMLKGLSDRAGIDSGSMRVLAAENAF